MPRALKIVLVALAIAVVIGALSLGPLRQRIHRLAVPRTTEEQARHAVLAPPISTPTDKTVTAKMFWASGSDSIVPVDYSLPLSDDPMQRSRQLLLALIADAPSDEQRTLPIDTALSSFYVLPDGTAIADFSDALTSEMPSGILSEEMAVNSIVRTLQANVPSLRRLKILIHGQEVDTLAGNVDLTGFFDLNPTAPISAPAAPTVAPVAPAKTTGR